MNCSTHPSTTIQSKSYIQSLQMLTDLENPQQCWKSVGFSFKFYLIVSMVLYCLSIFLGTIFSLLVDLPNLTIFRFQIWRLLFPYLIQIPSPLSILSVLFSFLWMMRFFNDRSKSTIYMLLEPFIINLQIHLVLNLLAFPLLFLVENSKIALMMGYGWFPVIIVYEFGKAAEDPDGHSRLCCLPFRIKNRYFPGIITFLLCLLSSQPLCIISAAILGYYQQMVRKSSIIKLPFSCYRVLDQCLLKLIKTRYDYTPVSQVQTFVNSHSWRASRRISASQTRSSRSANNNRLGQQQPPEKSFQENTGSINLGGGVKIDSNAEVTNFKNHWAFKDSHMKSNQSDEKTGELDPGHIPSPVKKEEAERTIKSEVNSGEISGQALIKSGDIADEDLI